MTSDLKFSSGSMTTIRGCMENFSLLFQFLGPDAACTKFGVTKCRSAPPPFLTYIYFSGLYHSTPGALNAESFPSPPLHASGRSLLWEQVSNNNIYFAYCLYVCLLLSNKR